jgi:ligand-binding sensor domain-containing protein
MIERVLRDKFDCVWFRAETFASYQCPADREPVTLSTDISAVDSSAHLEEASDGSIFMLVKMTLGRPGAFHSVTPEGGLPEPIDTAMIARDGTIWVGADKGLYRFMYPFRAEYWDRNSGISATSSVLLNGKDVYATSRGIFRLNPQTQRWDLLPNSTNFRSANLAGPGGTLFAIGLDSGVDRAILAQFTSRGEIVRQGYLPTTRYYQSPALAREGDGTLWLGGGRLDRVIQSGRQISFVPEKAPSGNIAVLEYDSAHDTLWGCDGNLVIFRKDGRWGQISQKDGLLNLACSAIGIEPGGDIWVGYFTKAIARIHNPASGRPVVQNYSQWLNDFTANRGTNFIRSDGENRLWWGTDAIYMADQRDAERGNWIRLDKRDWSGPGALPGDNRVLTVAQDNSIWLATEDGITHFSPPGDFATNFPTPSIFVAGFSVGGAQPTLADAMLPIPRNAPLVAHVGSLQFDRRNNIHLRYRVLPEQASWIPASTFNLALGKLRWGRHRLEVQAQLATGSWSSVAAQTFDITLPAWLTWPAWLLYGAGGTGIGFGARQWWRRREYERNLPLPDLTAWRLGALSPQTEALIGTVIDGRYEIGHILSVGGFATVARARDLKEDTLCAIKIFRFELGDRAWIRHRFEQEIAALEKVKHPNIVRITGHGAIASGAPYLVMEFVHGRNLREFLQKGALARAQAGEFLQQLAAALAELHRAQIFHRDLKPENLMIRTGNDGQPQIVLIDFSIAIVKAPEQTFHGISRVAGTLDYMAPEQVIGYADASTDIYSLAKVLLEMVTGVRWTEFLPEAKLDLPQQLREFFRGKPELFGANSIEMIVSALVFDPGGRPKDVILFAQPIVHDLKRG